MTTATANAIESAIDRYLMVERGARADLISVLSECLGIAEDEYLDFLDVMDNAEVSMASEAEMQLRLFIDMRAAGHPVSEKAKEDFISTAQLIRSEKIVGEALWIDACDFSYQQDEQLLRTIDLFMK